MQTRDGLAREVEVLGERIATLSAAVQRPRNQWIAIAVPAILDEEQFEAAQRVSRDNSRWSPRRAEPGHWLLRGLVKCGHCRTGVSCHKMRGRNGTGTFHRYYYCRNRDPLRAGGEHRRCPERNIRADELDTFVFEQVRDTLLRPDVLLRGEHAVSARREPAADELLQAQLAKLQRKIDAVAGERRRLADLYQAGFIGHEELLRRGNELQNREEHLRDQRDRDQRDALTVQRTELAHQNTLRQRIVGFSAQVGAAVRARPAPERVSLDGGAGRSRAGRISTSRCALGRRTPRRTRPSMPGTAAPRPISQSVRGSAASLARPGSGCRSAKSAAALKGPPGNAGPVVVPGGALAPCAQSASSTPGADS